MELYNVLRAAVRRLEYDHPDVDLTDDTQVARIARAIEPIPERSQRAALFDTWCAGAVDLFWRAKVDGRDTRYVAEFAHRVARSSVTESTDPDTTTWAAAVWAYAAGFLDAHQIPPPPAAGH